MSSTPPLSASLIAAVASLIFAAASSWVPGIWRALSSRWLAIAQKPWVSMLIAAGISFIVNAGITWRSGFPEPRVQDEFSYLLAADTYSHGRLTNPPHPLWRFFETFHELQQPTYASKYPPAQGLWLALGQMISGWPITGVWISTACLVAAAVWMLRGFVPPGWALAGALLLAVHPTITQWSRTYWGGSAPALGGVLLIGAIGRLTTAPLPISKPTRWIAITGGVGISILMISRPYEGLVFTVGCAVWLLLAGRYQLASQRWRSLWLLLLAPLGMTVFICYSNWRITGHITTLPYLQYERQYAVAPMFLWQPLRPMPPFDWPDMRDYATRVEVPHYLAQQSLQGFLHIASEKLLGLFSDSFGFILAMAPLLALPTVLVKHRRCAALLGLVGLIVLATLLSNWSRSQYVAPAAGAVAVLWVVCQWQLSKWSLPLGAGLSFGIFVGSLLLSVWSAAPGPQQFQRSQLIASLSHEPGRHVVLVHDLPDHRPDDAWVYNSADIDTQRVIFAHDAGDAANAPLLRYYAGRSFWRLDVAAVGVRIVQLHAHD